MDIENLKISVSINPEFVQGNTITITATFTNQDATPHNLDNQTAFFLLAESLQVGAPLIEQEITTFANPGGGIVEFLIDSSESLNLQPGNLVYEVGIKDNATTPKIKSIVDKIQVRPSLRIA